MVKTIPAPGETGAGNAYKRSELFAIMDYCSTEYVTSMDAIRISRLFRTPKLSVTLSEPDEYVQEDVCSELLTSPRPFVEILPL
jgi:hypothetical protein